MPRVCVHAKSLQSSTALCNTMDYSLPGSSVHGILQARILERVAMPSSRGSSRPRDRTQVSCVSCPGRQVLTTSAAWEAHSNLSKFTGLVTSRVRLLMWFFLKLTCTLNLLQQTTQGQRPDGYMCSFHLFLLLRRGPCQAQRSRSMYLLNEGTKD